MMEQSEIQSRLNELGLRLPADELPAFTVLVADMMQSAAIAAAPLNVGDEPASVFRLPRAG